MTTDPRRVGFAAWVLARAGAKDEATAILGRLNAMPRGTPGRAIGVMNATLGLGDLDRALDALGEAVVEAPQRLVPFTDIRYDPIRSDPRFAAVLRRVNLDVDRFTLPDGGRSK